MTTFYLQSTTKPELKFQIISRDKTTGMTRLRSMASDTEFEEHLDKDKLAALKYTIVKEENHADQV